MRFAFPLLVAIVSIPMFTLAAGCSSSTPAATTDDPLDPANDPPPADLPALGAYDSTLVRNVAADLSCSGKPAHVASGAAADREFRTIELGEPQEGHHVGGVSVELFFDDTLTNVNVIGEAKIDPLDPMLTGVFHVTVASGWIAYRIKAKAGFVTTSALDLEVPGDTTAPILVNIAREEKVQSLSVIIAGASFKPTPGAGRAVVVRVVDCKTAPVVGAHVALEVDGAVTKITPKDTPGSGVRRSYFGESEPELPSPALKWTSRSGVVAFLDIPPGTTTLRAVARGKLDNVVKVIGMRRLALVPGGILTAKVSPAVAPAP